MRKIELSSTQNTCQHPSLPITLTAWQTYSSRVSVKRCKAALNPHGQIPSLCPASCRTPRSTQQLFRWERKEPEGWRHYLVRRTMSKTTQSTGGFPTEFRPACEEGGGEGRAASSGQRVEVISDSVPGIQGERF